MFGYKGQDDYYENIAPAKHIDKIAIPTLYLLHEDDPIIRMNFTKVPFKENPNVALATTETGGHTASQESICKYSFWAMTPAIHFLEAM